MRGYGEMECDEEITNRVAEEKDPANESVDKLVFCSQIQKKKSGQCVVTFINCLQ